MKTKDIPQGIRKESKKAACWGSFNENIGFLTISHLIEHPSR